MERMSLKQARRVRGLSQEAVESKTGVNQATISKLERSARPNPSIRIVEMLERGLGLERGTLEFGPFE